MRRRRVKIKDRTAYYHIFSRVVDRDFKFGPAEKDEFRRILWDAVFFSDVKLLTFAIMSNHFHVLIKVVPRAGEIPEKTVLARIRRLYGEAYGANVEREWEELKKNGETRELQSRIASYTYRMNDMSEFGKTLKQRFTMRYNSMHKRTGTLWEGRFRSVIVEGDRCGEVLSAMAAYIDLNAVRAGIVERAEEYRWCGYGAAVRGNAEAREGIEEVLPVVEKRRWRRIAAAYEELLYPKVGQEFKREEVKQWIQKRKPMPVPILLRCRYKPFTGGMALGSKVFVEAFFEENRELFGEKRKTGARRIGHCSAWKGVCAARRLRKDVVTLPI